MLSIYSFLKASAFYARNCKRTLSIVDLSNWALLIQEFVTKNALVSLDVCEEIFRACAICFFFSIPSMEARKTLGF